MPKPTLSKSKYPFLFSNNHNSDQKIVVICDANVLYRVILRNLLMWMALDNLFEMHWTNEIQQEWSRNLLINKPDTDKAKIQKTLLLMREALPNANLASYSCPEDLESKLPDKKKIHMSLVQPLLVKQTLL